MTEEHQIPAHCPGCGRPIAVTGRDHCPHPLCTWLLCTCGVVMDITTGHAVGTPKGDE